MADLDSMPEKLAKFRDSRREEYKEYFNLMYMLNRFTIPLFLAECERFGITCSEEIAKNFVYNLQCGEEPIIAPSNKDSDDNMEYFFVPPKVQVIVSVIYDDRSMAFELDDTLFLRIARMYGKDPKKVIEFLMDIGLNAKYDLGGGNLVNVFERIKHL